MESPFGLPSKIAIVCGISLILLMPILLSKNDYIDQPAILFKGSFEEEFDLNISLYLVNSTKCKIPDVDPFHSEIIKFFHPHDYIPCRKKELLTYVTKTNNIATLHINSTMVPLYTTNTMSCCYGNITRREDKQRPDDMIDIGMCTEFTDSVRMYQDFVIVRCTDLEKNQTVYENTHVAITLKEEVRKKLEMFNNSIIKPFSVLMVGIDSVSRLNMLRGLPETYQFLEENEWIPLEGYNKIGDNTFPNIMGILSGFNESSAYAICNPTKLNKLDDCPMLWYDYRRLNYVTAYAEDETWMNTFNYKKKGFTKLPTDYYFRSYMQGAETLKRVRKDGMNYCTGPESSGERILNVAKDFATTFKSSPSFSFFWMNTFSHNDLNSITGMDKKVRGFLEEISSSGVLENSFVIFFSDHGMRFGEIRYTSVGWLEGRLPFVYISVPGRFKRQYPVEYKNLKNKCNQLTTPYDLHMTLQHLLVLSGFNYTTKASSACPKCNSLFVNGQPDRSCEDAAIEQHWCTCLGYKPVDVRGQTTTTAVTYLVDQIHQIIRDKGKESICAKYVLNKVISSSTSETVIYKNDSYVLLVVETEPKAVFEATLLYKNVGNETRFELQGGISRLDSYASHSKCTDDTFLKKYCYCM
jgi:hypothetical protein